MRSWGLFLFFLVVFGMSKSTINSIVFWKRLGKDLYFGRNLFHHSAWLAISSSTTCRALWSSLETIGSCNQKLITDLQGGPLLVINGIITPINGLIQGVTGVISPKQVEVRWVFHPTYNWFSGAHLVLIVSSFNQLDVPMPMGKFTKHTRLHISNQHPPTAAPPLNGFSFITMTLQFKVGH